MNFSADIRRRRSPTINLHNMHRATEQRLQLQAAMRALGAQLQGSPRQPHGRLEREAGDAAPTASGPRLQRPQKCKKRTRIRTGRNSHV